MTWVPLEALTHQAERTVDFPPTSLLPPTPELLERIMSSCVTLAMSLNQSAVSHL